MSKSWLLQLSLSIWDLSLGLRWDSQSEVHSTKTQPNQLTNCQIVNISSDLFSEVIISTYLILFWPYFDLFRHIPRSGLCGWTSCVAQVGRWVIESLSMSCNSRNTPEFTKNPQFVVTTSGPVWSSACWSLSWTKKYRSIISLLIFTRFLFFSFPLQVVFSCGNSQSNLSG